jgi:hypothetical protein
MPNGMLVGQQPIEPLLRSDMSTNALQRSFRKTVARIPLLGPVAKKVYNAIAPTTGARTFTTSPEYWNERYISGGNSGAGSYGRLARFKADVLNKFVSDQAISSIIEFGCGDGEQLKLARYPLYTGIDVSMRAVEICQSKFAEDSTKTFYHIAREAAQLPKADLSMSLDVLYHLIEDNIYHDYMSKLFFASRKFVCIYSSNCERPAAAKHVRHRRFSDWILHHQPAWKLVLTVPNLYPEDETRPEDTSFADFYFFSSEPSVDQINRTLS